MRRWAGAGPAVKPIGFIGAFARASRGRGGETHGIVTTEERSHRDFVECGSLTRSREVSIGPPRNGAPQEWRLVGGGPAKRNRDGFVTIRTNFRSHCEKDLSFRDDGRGVSPTRRSERAGKNAPMATYWTGGGRPAAAPPGISPHKLGAG